MILKTGVITLLLRLSLIAPPILAQNNPQLMCAISRQPEASVNTQYGPDLGQISTNSHQSEDSTNTTSIASVSTSTMPPARGIKIVGDNVDKTVKARYMRVDKSLHYAAQGRMPDEVPSNPDTPDSSELLPSDYDKEFLPFT